MIKVPEFNPPTKQQIISTLVSATAIIVAAEVLIRACGDLVAAVRYAITELATLALDLAPWLYIAMRSDIANPSDLRERLRLTGQLVEGLFAVIP